jgi:hypothetical protein
MTEVLPQASQIVKFWDASGTLYRASRFSTKYVKYFISIIKIVIYINRLAMLGIFLWQYDNFIVESDFFLLTQLPSIHYCRKT